MQLFWFCGKRFESMMVKKRFVKNQLLKYENNNKIKNDNFHE